MTTIYLLLLTEIFTSTFILTLILITEISGHSFGAFHALNVAHLAASIESDIQPNIIAKLLLVNPAGILPMTGKDGTALAVLFKWGRFLDVCSMVSNN